MEKLQIQSKDCIAENIQKIGQLFPHCIVETKDDKGKLAKKIDFDLLQQELQNEIVGEDKKRYSLQWAGKKSSIIESNKSIDKTIRPSTEESQDFDKTKNLFIEGDNLEVLKLLQTNYLNKVKMIYIDPPYNTGKDFIYKDNFKQDKGEYEEDTEQRDEDGNKLVSNPESNGRFHSDWLSMIYPRLRLARNLLREDGVIFISIDDNEQANLKRLCDEVFGENNFVAQFVWRKKTGASDAKGIATITEYILLYVKSIDHIDSSLLKNKKAHDPKRYRLTDIYQERRGNYYIDNLDRSGIQYSDSMNYAITCPDGSITYPNGRTFFENDGWTWIWGKDKLLWGIQNGFIEFRKSNTKKSGWAVCYKNYLNVNNKNEIQERVSPYKNLITDIINTAGTKDISKLFEQKVFKYTKPVGLLSILISFVNFLENDIILDFFAGSGTTAHAVMQQNAEDGGNRRFILVQLPEKCKEDTDAYKAGFATIADIAKERIRRAAKQIKEQNPTANKLDTGFRVLKVDSTNMNHVYFSPEELTQEQLATHLEPIKPDRTPNDLLFQVLLAWGLDLSLSITQEELENSNYFIIGKNELDSPILACLERQIISESFCTLLAKKHKPISCVFRADCFTDDSTQINIEEIFKLYSPDTTIKVI